jgi:DNA modification methylase
MNTCVECGKPADAIFTFKDMALCSLSCESDLMDRLPTVKLLHGDCLDVLKTLPDQSMDSLVTDPPAGISFMGKKWDDDKGGRDYWVAWFAEVSKECLRVLKPGAHGLVWALPRTSHWTATALENAGFEVRDVINHLFGTGFPKSLDISKAIDKASGAERNVVGIKLTKDIRRNVQADIAVGKTDRQGKFAPGSPSATMEYPITEASTDAAKQWQGWGTALKPACEHWLLVRKPLSEKTVAKNVLKHGTGGINIDASRIATSENIDRIGGGAKGNGKLYGDSERYDSVTHSSGRFPANLILSHSDNCQDNNCSNDCAVRLLDEQSGFSRSPGKVTRGAGGQHGKLSPIGRQENIICPSDSGGASRFFYCAKASKADRNAGLEKLLDKPSGAYGKFAGDGRGRQTEHKPEKNNHPTVKNTKLMRYLINMITPPMGTVIDPFMGSGSTGVACKGFSFVGIEADKAYFEIAEKRILNK